MNDNFSTSEQPTVNDNDVDEQYVYYSPDEIDEMTKILDKIFEALGVFEPVSQPEPPPRPDQPHHGQSDAIADVLREPERLGFHDGVYYWEPWHVESNSGNPPEATD